MLALPTLLLMQSINKLLYINNLYIKYNNICCNLYARNI